MTAFTMFVLYIYIYIYIGHGYSPRNVVNIIQRLPSTMDGALCDLC
jgi:hypothetical protein